MRGKYRSAIYATRDTQAAEAGRVLAALGRETGERYVTQVLRHRGFKPSEARFHDYYARAPERPFCRTHIAPKRATLHARFARLLQDNEAAS
jgi:peptide-methionine (S)-S-oxide reductase